MPEAKEQWNYLERKPSQEWIEVGYDDKDWNGEWEVLGLPARSKKLAPSGNIRHLDEIHLRLAAIQKPYE